MDSDEVSFIPLYIFNYAFLWLAIRSLKGIKSDVAFIVVEKINVCSRSNELINKDSPESNSLKLRLIRKLYT